MSHSFNENGIFTVAVRVADDDGSTDIATLEVRVPVTVIAVNAGADKVVDEGDNVSFSGSFNNPAGGTAHTIVWNLGDGSTAAGTLTPSHIYPDNGTYTITLTITDEFDNIGQDTLTVTVNDLSPIAALNGDTILVPDQTGNFDASGSISSPDEITGYEWDWNYNGTFNPSEDTGETQSHSYNEPGIYNVAVRVTDDDGSADIATLVVVVSSTVLEVDAGPDQNVYKNDIVNFNGNFNDQNEGVTYTYLWDFGDNNTSEGALTPSHVYAETGVFTVTLTITGDDGSFGTDTLIVTVTEPGETSVDLQINAGTKNEDYVMISFPIDCDNIDAVDLLELKVNTKDLRLGTYDPNYPPPDGTGGYIEYGKGLKIQKGRAYFILSRSALKISANCLRVSLNQDIEVPLWFNPNNQNGWNQIGPPNDRDYTWEDVEVISKDGNGAIIFGPVAIKNLPNENNYIDKRLWEYKPDGTYDPDTAILRSKKGYFIRVKRANVFLVFSRNAQIAQNSSMTNVLLAQTKENLKRFFDKWILSPNNAFAVSNDYPPGPIGNFTVEKSGSSSGGCFIEAANDGFPLRPKGVILILLSLIIMLGIAVGRKINKRLKVL
jgi:PKD repeat protein